jgi:hypothetical protein
MSSTRVPVLTRSAVDDGIDEHLNGVLQAQMILNDSISTHLARQQMNDLKRRLDNTNGQQLFAIVAAVHHK